MLFDSFRSWRDVIQRLETPVQRVLVKIGCHTDTGWAVSEISEHNEEASKAATKTIQSTKLLTWQGYQKVCVEVEGWTDGIHFRDLPCEKTER